MIKRKYFYSFSWHQGKNGQMRIESGISECRSLMADPQGVYAITRDRFIDNSKKLDGDGEFQAIAFNRI